MLLVIIGVGAMESALPLWPEVLVGASGASSRGAELWLAFATDAAVIRQHGLQALLTNIEALQYLTVSALLAVLVGVAWACHRYLTGARDDDAGGHPPA
jgi:hypothetical protein